MPETTDENDQPGEALFDAPPGPRVRLVPAPSVNPDPLPKADDQRRRAELIARAYREIRPLTTIAKVRPIILAAIKGGRWTDEEIRAAVLHFANKAWKINAEGLEGHLKRSAGHVSGTASRSAPKPKGESKPRENPLPPRKTAVYRFYDADRTLLYVGRTPAPVDRFHEHRDTKPWWKEVTHHSIAWWNTPEQALAKEEFAIKDEWPLYNEVHQPRKGSGYRIPSHVADAILQVVRKAVIDEIPEVPDMYVDDVVANVAAAFDVKNSDYPTETTCGMWFGKSQAPANLEVTDLDEMRRRIGSLRPDIDGSARLSHLPELDEES